MLAAAAKYNYLISYEGDFFCLQMHNPLNNGNYISCNYFIIFNEEDQLQPIKIFCGVFFFVLVSFQIVQAEDFSKPEPRVLVNNIIYKNIKPQIINNEAYLPARDMCSVYGGDLYWNSSSKTIAIKYNDKIYRPQSVLRGNKSLISVKSLKEIYGLKSVYFPEQNVVAISRVSLPSAADIMNYIPSYQGYTREDLLWLAKIVHAEAKGESYASKLAVANVILNRKASSQYPNTIKGVIFDKRFGIQFSPTADGSINNTPSNDSFMAAVDALEGKNNAEAALFFLNPRYARSSWISNNRSYAFTKENHDFYY